jgi:kynurenine formamidase
MLRLVDLSFDIYDGAPTFEPDPKTQIRAHLKISDLNYNMTEIIMSAHYGTHLDAPFHFFDDGKTVENLDVRKGFGLAYVLDFSNKKPGEPITLEEVQPYADKIKKGSRLIFHTNWDKVIGDPKYFGGQPYLTVELSSWLAQQGVACIALDTPTTYPAEYTASHHSLLNGDAEVLIIEGLRGLERLQSKEVILMALPLRIRGRDGSPCRAMAIDGDIEALKPLFEQLQYDIVY